MLRGVSIALFVFTGLACAQIRLSENVLKLEPGAAPGKASIEDVAWMSGQWQGQGLGGFAEEIWAPPDAGRMTGMFRQMKAAEVWFYEFFVMTEEQGSLVLRLKHFHQDLKGWEEKDQVREFRLVKLDEKGAWFDGLTFLRDGADGMVATVAIKSKDGKLSEGRFVYKRAASLAKKPG